VHRDLKPANIFLEDLPGLGARARILDFGVCKLDAHDGESLTSTGEAVGTISYMAPEQIRGASKVDERADVYSFATVIFEALSGRLAHDASGQIAMIASKLERPARHLRDTARVPVPSGVDPLLARCLSRSPSERPSSATELLRTWRALGGHMVVPTPMPPMTSGARNAHDPRNEITYATETGLIAGAPSRLGPRGTRAGLIVAACALLASTVVLVMALRSRSSSSEASAHSPIDTASTTLAAPIPTQAPAAVAPTPTAVEAVAEPASLAQDEPISLDDPDAGAPAKRPSKPGSKRKAPPPRAAAGRPSGPQIVAEPRY
jgi:serine/threonine protein kinase